MILTAEQLRVVVIDCPYESFSSAHTQALLMEALSLKLRSYQDVYPNGVLPLDSYDFVSTHHLIGMESSTGTFRPLMVYRTVTTTRCRKHGLEFPILTLLREAHATRHARILEERIREWGAREESISYGSGWAIAPELRGNREARDLLKDVMTAMHVTHSLENQVDHLIGIGILRVHTDRYFENIGYSRVASGEGVLEPFAPAYLLGDEAVLLHAPSFNERAREIARRHEALWTNRIRAPEDLEVHQRRKAA